RCVREQTELIDDATDRNIRRLDHQRLPPAVQRPQRFSDDTLVICRERRVLRDRLEELKAASNLQLVLRRAEDERRDLIVVQAEEHPDERGKCLRCIAGVFQRPQHNEQLLQLALDPDTAAAHLDGDPACLEGARVAAKEAVDAGENEEVAGLTLASAYALGDPVRDAFWILALHCVAAALASVVEHVPAHARCRGRPLPRVPGRERRLRRALLRWEHPVEGGVDEAGNGRTRAEVRGQLDDFAALPQTLLYVVV